MIPYFTTSYRPERYSRCGKREQNFRIGDDQLWRIERADQIFSLGQIYAGLPADGAVHLRHQRRRNVHQTDASQVSCRCETRHVADDSAAHGDNRRVPIGTSQHELPCNLFDRCEVFR